jgi:hypothetical protein
MSLFTAPCPMRAENTRMSSREVSLLYFNKARTNNKVWRQQSLAYSLSTFTNTSSDAQNIVWALSSSPTAYHGAPANQFHSDVS